MDQMARAVPFGFEIETVVIIARQAHGNPFGDGESTLLKLGDLLWIVGDQA